MPPIGTPGCTGGGTGRIGALYTGLGPVCGTIIRGAGGGGGVGRAGAETAEGAGVETEAGAAGICAGGGGATGRGGATTGVVAAGAATTGRGATTGGGATTAGGGGEVGFMIGGATAAGRLTEAGGAVADFSGTAGATGGAAARGAAGGGAPASFFCVIALSTSPGREMFERSIFVLISSSPREARELDLPAEDDPSAEERIYTRTFSASWSSRELECVFFSVTPTKGSVSRIARLFTSNSRARSLIRTLLIRPFDSPCCKLGLHCDLTESISLLVHFARTLAN